MENMNNRPKHPILEKRLKLLYAEMDAAEASNDFVECMLLADKLCKIEDKLFGKEVVTGSLYGVTKDGKKVQLG
jgi:hypothetical protein